MPGPLSDGSGMAFWTNTDNMVLLSEINSKSGAGGVKKNVDVHFWYRLHISKSKQSLSERHSYDTLFGKISKQASFTHLGTVQFWETFWQK